MVTVFFGLLVGFEIKHFIADYLLQPGWILAGKGDFRKPGGYAHAGIHAGFSVVLMLLFGTPSGLAVALGTAELVVHYALDYSKVQYSKGVHADTAPSRFWALHGVDQLAHQLTYVALIYAVLKARGLV